MDFQGPSKVACQMLLDFLWPKTIVYWQALQQFDSSMCNKYWLQAHVTSAKGAHNMCGNIFPMGIQYV